jgi:hypothetical protein
VRQVDLAERPLVRPHVDDVPWLVDAVEREVLRAGHDVVALHALDQRFRHLPEEVRVFAVRLLGAAPTRVAEYVDANPSVEVESPVPARAAGD